MIFPDYSQSTTDLLTSIAHLLTFFPDLFWICYRPRNDYLVYYDIQHDVSTTISHVVISVVPDILCNSSNSERKM